MSAPARSARPLTAAELIHALSGNAETGMCRCPAHDDETPSLHVSQGQGKAPLFHCHAGCSAEAVIGALRSRGLWGGGGTWGSPPKPPKRGDTLPPDQADYARFMKAFAILRAAALAEAGSPTAYLQTRGLGACPESAMLLPAKDSRRLLGVGFPAMVLPVVGPKGLQGAHVTLLSRDGGAKLAVRDGRPRRMFGKVKGGYAQLAEINLGGTLIIGEGVESTLSAMQLSGWPGIAALSASGLSAVRPPHATEYVIAADNDDSGRAAAAALAERLEYEGKHVRIALPRPEGLDWNDRLRRAKAAEQEWRAALTAENQPAAAAKFHILEDFMELTFPKREMLLAPWLPQPGIAMIFARAGHGKTYLALSIAFAVARGDDLLGWQCERPGRVLYVDGEMPGAYLQTRLSQYGRPPRGTLHIVCRDTFNLRRQAMPDLATPEGRRSIDDIIKQVQPDLVILDSLSTLVRTGEENSPEDWLPVQDWLMSHRWRGRTMLMIHHAGKGGSQRGTSKREDTPETSIKLTKQPRDADAADDESLFELEYMKGREVFGAGEEPLRLRLAIRDGRVTWTHETVRDARKEKVREMLDAGMKQRDIARELGVGEARVSQIKKELTEQGNVVKFPNQRERDA